MDQGPGRLRASLSLARRWKTDSLTEAVYLAHIDPPSIQALNLLRVGWRKVNSMARKAQSWSQLSRVYKSLRSSAKSSPVSSSPAGTTSHFMQTHNPHMRKAFGSGTPSQSHLLFWTGMGDALTSRCPGMGIISE